MLLGRIAGTVVATRKEPLMEGWRLLVVQQLGVDNKPTGGYVVADDAVGAGVGEVVLYASGSSARQTEVTRDRPCDAVIMAIVDTWEIGGPRSTARTHGRARDQRHHRAGPPPRRRTRAPARPPGGDPRGAGIARPTRRPGDGVFATLDEAVAAAGRRGPRRPGPRAAQG